MIRLSVFALALGTRACRVILIAGTGRAGTTFLVEELTAAGAPTSFNQGAIAWTQGTEAHAGLETMPALENDGALSCSAHHRIFKSPYLTTRYRQWANATNIEAVVIPVRAAQGAAHSRAKLDRGPGTNRPGGFVAGATTEAEQLAANTRMSYDLVYALAAADVPMIFLAYPRHVRDVDYTFSRLESVLESMNITKSKFARAHAATFRKDFVHSSNTSFS